MLLKKGADPNVRLTKELWYFAFNNCGNANCGLEYLEGTHGVLARGVRARRGGDEAVGEVPR